MTAVSGAWADSWTSGDCTVTLSGGVMTVCGTGAMANYSSFSDIPWYSNKDAITSVVIESGVTNIGNGAFYKCTNLASVDISATVTSIGKETFAESGSSTGMAVNIATGSALEAIGDKAFLSSNLASITLPEGLTTIGDMAFVSCTKLASITLPSCLTTIGKQAFQETAITTVEIPANVASIGESPFKSCTNLATITVAAGNTVFEAPNGCNAIIDIDSHTLIQGCNGTVFANLPATLTSIGTSSCSECNFASVNIPDGVTSIGNYAFSKCSGLTTVVLPASVTSIGGYAFGSCSSLATVTIYAVSQTTYVGNAFYNAPSGLKIYVPAGSGSTYKSGWSNYANKIEEIMASGYCGTISVNDGKNVIWTLTSDGVLTISGTGAMADYSSPSAIPWSSNISGITSVVIEDGVTTIGNGAFFRCNNLASVSIPSTVISIGVEAFAESGSNSSTGMAVTIATGSALGAIGNNAFLVSNLASITLPDGLTTIGKNAFKGCGNLATVTLNSNPFIGDDAFNDIKAGAAVTMNLTANSAGGAYWMTFYNKNYSFEADANTQVFKVALTGIDFL